MPPSILLPQIRRFKTVDVGDEDDGGLGVLGAGDVRLDPAEAVHDLALAGGGVERRWVRAALRARHAAAGGEGKGLE